MTKDERKEQKRKEAFREMGTAACKAAQESEKAWWGHSAVRQL